ncbi:hypothetical protein B4U79_05538 [Dinothrombium tinctorium]|uniref:ISXO2-like transposase domain-containing protein n=1 Tax=Dinothrombium tinctorium TaxID=1965070 RepID=A0A443QG39_9ACAR|nr:hypothetical protein B4U79_05538 [Dinothrombium tinctorium]
MPGTTIVTDCWAAYNQLSNYGYMHLTVNHSQNFVDPNTGANTQSIESQWRNLRRRLSSGIRHENLAPHLCEFLWRRFVSHANKDPFV